MRTASGDETTRRHEWVSKGAVGSARTLIRGGELSGGGRENRGWARFCEGSERWLGRIYMCVCMCDDVCICVRACEKV